MGWKMFSNTHFEITKGEYTGIINGFAFGCRKWSIVRNGANIDDWHYHKPIYGHNSELAAKAFIEKRLQLLNQPVNP